jgi:hypothetical protein
MVLTLDRILLVLAFVCFVMAATGAKTRVDLLPLGLAFWILSLL